MIRQQVHTDHPLRRLVGDDLDHAVLFVVDHGLGIDIHRYLDLCGIDTSFLGLLQRQTDKGGFRLMPRLPVYPAFVAEEWIDPVLLPKVQAAIDDEGYALAPQLEAAT